jgi:hypothetical protein
MEIAVHPPMVEIDLVTERHGFAFVDKMFDER